MQKERIKVLYIDDEVNNLQAFKALFRKDYEVFIADSAQVATEILDVELIHVIISDQRMPGMTGVEFFESILEKHPHPIRILLTGYTDIQAVIEAINRGQIYRFIDKPWDQQVIAVAIQNAYDIYNTRFLLREQNVQLKKAYDELDKFVYSASHDLRAPLASILGLIKVIKTDDIANAEKYIQLIEGTVLKMDVFVQNIIKYYRTNRVDVEINHINYTNMINEILYDYDAHTKVKLTEINKDFVEPVFNRSDENRIRIILSNIIMNAIRFYDEHKDSHIINIRLLTTPVKASIEIEDNGVGMTEAEANSVFEMFYRGSHKNAGSGVGLYVASEALKKINGNIKVESEYGQGSKFIIEIPNLA